MDKLIRNSTVEFLIFTSANGDDSIEVKVFDSEELEEDSVSFILEHTAKDIGKITKKIADEYAISEFEKYRIVQDRLFMSDFDKLLLDMENNSK